jgi:hypothetical protein
MLEGWQVRIFVRELESAFGSYGRQSVGIRIIWPNIPAWAGPISAMWSADAKTRRSGR